MWWCGDWLIFGDYGYLNVDGYLFLIGWENCMVIIFGLNVYFEEIEMVFVKYFDVVVVVVFGFLDWFCGQCLEVVIELWFGSIGNIDVICWFCWDVVGFLKILCWFYWCDVLFLIFGGKLDL